MDNQSRLPLMNREEYGEILRFIRTVPPYVLWNAAEIMQSFKYDLRGWSAQEQWYVEIVSQMIDFIADYDSSEAFVQEFAHQITSEIGSSCAPFSPAQLRERIVLLGMQMRESLLRAGMYEYKRTLLYKFSRFVVYDVLLARLDAWVDDVSCIDAIPAQPGPLQCPQLPPNF